MSDVLTTVHTDAAPAAIGPYSQAVVAGDLVFLSGQIPLDPATGAMVSGDFAVEVRRVLAIWFREKSIPTRSWRVNRR